MRENIKFETDSIYVQIIARGLLPAHALSKFERFHFLCWDI